MEIREINLEALNLNPRCGLKGTAFSHSSTLKLGILHYQQSTYLDAMHQLEEQKIQINV